MTTTALTPVTSTLRYVDVFDAPVRGPLHGPLDLDDTQVPADLPDAAHRLLADLVNRVDEDTCGAPGCHQPLGWVLREDTDRPHASGVDWFPLALLIRADGSPVAVCEDCSPSSTYGSAGHNA